MKRISTLLTAVAVFLTVQTKAQYTEYFETDPTLGGHGCIATTDFKYVTTSDNNIAKYVITGNGSGYAEPPVSGTPRVFSTPYLSLPDPVTIAFDYKLSSKLSNGAGRFINVGLIDANGNFSSLDSFGLADIVNVVNYNRTFDLPAPTIARVSIRMGGFGGDGNTRVIYDNIVINAPMVNGGNCNQAPIAQDNMYSLPLSSATASGNVILDGTSVDSDPDGLVTDLTAKIVSGIASTQGILILNSNGAFSFVPAASFAGGPITFTYSITDNGYPRLSSTATVTLNYPDAAFIPMPVKLMSFAGSATSNHVQLRWAVADNETGEYFEVLRSVDGKHFTEAGVVFTDKKVGAQSYTYGDPKELDAITYYQLKIVNKDESISFSNVIILKSTADKNNAGITILQNPVGSTLTFTYTAGVASQGQVSIYNMLGAKVYGSRISSQQGLNTVSLNLDSHMASGTYILEVVNGAERAVARMLKK